MVKISGKILKLKKKMIGYLNEVDNKNKEVDINDLEN
jgi:hypothetical protein